MEEDKRAYPDLHMGIQCEKVWPHASRTRAPLKEARERGSGTQRTVWMWPVLQAWGGGDAHAGWLVLWARPPQVLGAVDAKTQRCLLVALQRVEAESSL